MSSPSRPCRPAAPLYAAAVLLFAACGSDPAEPTRPPDQPPIAAATAPPALVQVSAGQSHTCGITAAGQAWCWGMADNGQLGTGDDAIRLVPTPVAGNLVFRRISAGGLYTCGVTTDNRIWCWGANFNGGLGTGDEQRRYLPVQVASTLAWQTVSAGFGSGHTCALTTDRVAYCWGFNGDGALGDGSRTSRSLPAPVAGGRKWREISAGYSHTCGVTSGRIALCWGADDRGQLGDNPERGRRVVPRRVAGDLLYDQISAGFLHSCGVTTDARVLCWGAGLEGQIGDGKLLDRFIPTAVAGTRTYRRVSARGVSHTCAETLNSRLFCWGLNAWGSLGDGTTDPSPRPVAVATDLRFVQMSAGADHSCAVTAAAVAYCWGANEFAQLGDGSIQVSRYSPVPVAGGS